MADTAPLWQQAPPAPPPQAPAQPQQPAAPPPQPQWLSAPAVGTLASAHRGAGDLDAIEDPNKLAGVIAQGVASLPTDPDARARYLAKKLFPMMSDKAALDRVGFRNGRVVYLADDGKTYYAEPSFSPIDNPKRTLIEAPQLAASAIGPSLSAAGSIAGGALTPEFGAGIPGAAAGGAAGDATRQALAAWLTKESVPPMDRALSLAENAALGGLGEGAGKAMFKGAQVFANRGNPLKVSGYDLARATPPRINAAEADMQLAQRGGVTVTPGEATNMRSLLNRQRQLGRQEEGATPLADFYLKRNTEQLPSAFDKMVLSKISPQSAPALGARDLQQGAQDTIDAAVKARSKATSPFYRAAAGDVVPSPKMAAVIDAVDAEIKKGGSDKVLAQLQSLRNDLIAQSGKPEVPATLSRPGGVGRDFVPGTPGSPAIPEKPVDQVGPLDSIRKYWRDRVALPDIAPEATPKEVAARINPILSQLRATMEESSPNFAQGRAIHAQMSPAVSTLEEGLTGLAAKDRASGLQNVPTTMFGVASADPISISSARAAFLKAGKMDQWNAGVRSYLDGLFQAAAKQAQGPASGIWKAIKGDSRQYANLKAALEPGQLSALDDFMKIAEMVKRAPAEGSQTASDLGAKGGFAGPVARGMAKIARAANPLNIPDAVANWIIDRSAGKNVAQLVDIITSPNSVRQLRQLKMLSPGSKKWTAGITNLITQFGADQIPPPSPDQPLGYLLQRPPTP